MKKKPNAKKGKATDQKNKPAKDAEEPARPAAPARPSLGRIVIYRDPDRKISAEGEIGRECAAMIVGVFPDGSVNLRLFRDNNPDPGEYKTGVLLGDAAGDWHWPGRV